MSNIATHESNPIYTVLPDCAFPLIFSSEQNEYPYGMAGTGFLIKCGSKAFFITAKHCLGQTNEEIQVSVNNLCLPISPSTHDLIPLTEWGEISISGEPPIEILEALSGDNFDLVVITVDITTPRIASVITDRAINLPPTGEWLEKFKKNIVACAPESRQKVLAEIRGFPINGTDSKVNYESQRITTQGIVLRGHLTWENAFPHTESISFLEEHCTSSDFDGISGSPVFVPLKTETGISYTLAGMMIRASNMKGHFITISWLVLAIEAALTEG